MLELYIANRKADIPENFSVLFNYNSTEVSNPTAIKNKYTSSILLPGTPENNKLFGDIWKLGRVLIPKTTGIQDQYSNGKLLSSVNFDPRKRVDFKIYNNSDLVESGYIQLTEVLVGLNDITYRIQLYGGIGDFFYSLQYDDDNVEKSLASLYYGWKSTPEEENSAKLGIWNKNFIDTSWGELDNVSSHNIDEDITAIPTYSGQYQDFSGNKVMVNVPSLSGYYSEASTLFPSSIVNDGTTYSLYKSKYAIVDTPRNLAEFEARDLRSNNQRVGLRFSSFFDAISNPQNNGGYSVVLDQEIAQTPYYEKSWILLDRPQFDSSSNNTDNLNGNLYLLDSDASRDTDLTTTLYTNFDTSGYNNPSLTYNLNLNLEYRMTDQFYQTHWEPTTHIGNCYEYNIQGTSTKRVIWDYVAVRFEMYDPGTLAIIDNSDTFLLMSGSDLVPSGLGYIPSIGYTRLNVFNEASSRVSSFVYSTYGGIQKGVVPLGYNKTFVSQTTSIGTVYDYYNSSNTLTLRWEGMTKNSNFKLRARAFKLRQVADSSDFTTNPTGWTWSTTVDDYRQWYYIVQLNYAYNNPSVILGYTNELYAENITFNIASAYIEDDTEVGSSPYAITKDKIFGTSSNPLKYLLDWTKMFDLRFRVDQHEKIVYIDKRNNYYQNEIKPLRVDLAKDIKISPAIAKYKSFMFGLPVSETYASSIYNRKTNDPYGRLKFNTGYEFNNESNDLYENSVYKGLIPYAMNSYYFSHQGTGDLPSCVLSPTYDYSLYSSGGTDDTYTATLSYSWSYISSTYSISYNDRVPKLCIFSNEENYLDGINSIVFYNGKYSNTDIQLSDNMQEMIELNNSPCYLLSRSAGEVIVPSDIPMFSNSYIDPLNNTVYPYSFNFAAPRKEIKNAELDYTYRAPIYYGFWDSYAQDLYNENGKSIEVYAFLEGKPEDMMRKFWYYDDSTWIIDQIKNYNISDTSVPVQMVLIKVDNPTNYLITY